METKRKTGIKVQYDQALGTISWVDITGEIAPLVLRLEELKPEIREQAMWHGLDQKVTDAGAMGNDHWDGKDKPKRYATTGERLGRMKRVVENLNAGSWNVKSGGDPLANKGESELKALIALAQAKLASIGIKQRDAQGSGSEI